MINAHNLSSDSDGFEGFLQKIKTQEKENKYRLSTDSLSQFLTDNSHTSSCNSSEDEETCEKNFNNLRESRSCKLLENNTENKTGKASKPHISIGSHLSKENVPSPLKSIENLKGNKGCALKVKSVSTPIKQVFFSSDSDDDNDVFLPQSTSKNGKTPHKSLVFSDSDEELDYKIPVSAKPPVLLLSSGSDSDDFDVIPSLQSRILSQNDKSKVGLPKSSVKADKAPTMKTSDKPSIVISDDDDDFLPLKARLFKNHPRSNSGDYLKLKGPVPVIGSLSTPKNKSIPKQHFQTEKAVKSSNHSCLVKGCFLTSLDLKNPKNSGTNFKRSRVELTSKLYKLFNDSVFDGRLPITLEVSWAKRLTKTAGITKCRRITRTERDAKTGQSVTTRQYKAAISLSEKVIDCANRLRDTLIHEMCHAAVWLLNNANESHGPFWKSWAARARRVHPELPSIERCHNYDIEYKYVYQCTRCMTTIGRHSKSIDTTKKVCGRCSGKLVLNPGKKSDGSARSKGSNPFANFVKENYKTTKSSMETNKGSVSHRDVMKSLSEKFKTASLS